MRRSHLTLCSAAMAVLAGCTQGSGPTPKATVLTLETGLTAADKLALNYVTLPACVTGGAAICSDPATVTKLKGAGLTAYNTITAAQTAVDADPSASSSTTSAAIADATAGLAAFNASIPATKGAAQ